MTELGRLRNVAIVGNHHAGKTTLLEAMLAHSGAISRKGNVADGTTVTDFEPECIDHAQSTTIGFAHTTHDGNEITFVDCPGFIDFFEETRYALEGVDSVVVVLDADPTRIAQTRGLFDAIEARLLPHLIVINKMDRPGADFDATLAALQAQYGRHVVAHAWPLGNEEAFTGAIDLAHLPAKIPEHLASRVATAHSQLLEAMADFDDHLLEELLEGTDPPADEIDRDLCAECSHDQIVPVVPASGLTGVGIAQILDAIVALLPSPDVNPLIDITSGEPIAARSDGPIVARIIKTSIHPQSGKLSIVRIVTGTLAADSQLTNASRPGQSVRCAGLYKLQGKKQEPLQLAGPGEIVAIARLEAAGTGDVLVSNGHKIMLAPVHTATPVFAVAIRPKERMDEAKLSQMLARIIDEDPSLCITHDDTTHELLLLGHGEQHVMIAIERLARKYKVDVETSPPAIPYLETITAETDVHSRYKHQTGGHGQFADVWLRFAPRERGAGISFEEKIVGGVVPKQYFPAVEKGVREALLHGTVGGYPVTDIHVVLHDGQYHDVDSSEQAFRTAAGMGVRDALPKCKPVVLEPIVTITVTVPTTYTSTVIAQLTGKRGQILGMKPSTVSGIDEIEAHVPQVELSRYITELRTATMGLGTFSWKPLRYEPAPPGRIPSKTPA